jgi:hypothetical protein
MRQAGMRPPGRAMSPLGGGDAALDQCKPYTASRIFAAVSKSTDTSCEMPRSAMVTP